MVQSALTHRQAQVTAPARRPQFILYRAVRNNHLFIHKKNEKSFSDETQPFIQQTRRDATPTDHFARFVLLALLYRVRQVH